MNGNEAVEERSEAASQGGEGLLWGLLQDLVAREGKVRTAERLGVSERTLRRTLESEHLSRRMTSALLREQNELRDERRAAREARLESLIEQVQQLERRLGKFEQVTGEQLDELSERVAAAARHAVEAKERVASAAGRAGLATAAPGLPGTPTEALAPRRVKLRPERLHKLVTVEPAEDDAAVYREALPLVAEWRRCLVARKDAPHTYAWLQGEVRLLELEIQLIDEYRLSLPPATDPWDGIRRHTELRLSLQVLERMRRRLRWTRPLHWTARLVTLGLWGRSPSLEGQLQGELQDRRWGLLAEEEQPEQEAEADT